MNNGEAKLLNVHLITEIFDLHGRKCSFCVRAVASVEHYNVQIHTNAGQFQNIDCRQDANSRLDKLCRLRTAILRRRVIDRDGFNFLRLRFRVDHGVRQTVNRVGYVRGVPDYTGSHETAALNASSFDVLLDAAFNLRQNVRVTCLKQLHGFVPVICPGEAFAAIFRRIAIGHFRVVGSRADNAQEFVDRTKMFFYNFHKKPFLPGINRPGTDG